MIWSECYKNVMALSAAYQRQMMVPEVPSHSRIIRSSSHTMPLLNRPAHSKGTRRDCSFSSASSARNSISNDVRCAVLLSSLISRLKMYLLRSVYMDNFL